MSTADRIDDLCESMDGGVIAAIKSRPEMLELAIELSELSEVISVMIISSPKCSARLKSEQPMVQQFNADFRAALTR